MRTGLVAFFNSLRTAVLPFLFIFNTQLLLIDVTWWQAVIVFVTATLAMLMFTATMQGYFLARSRISEPIALLLVAFTLFRPGCWLDLVVVRRSCVLGKRVSVRVERGGRGI